MSREAMAWLALAFAVTADMVGVDVIHHRRYRDLIDHRHRQIVHPDIF
jgi:hypothetical protein